VGFRAVRAAWKRSYSRSDVFAWIGGCLAAWSRSCVCIGREIGAGCDALVPSCVSFRCCVWLCVGWCVGVVSVCGCAWVGAGVRVLWVVGWFCPCVRACAGLGVGGR